MLILHSLEHVLDHQHKLVELEGGEGGEEEGKEEGKEEGREEG